MPDAEFIISVGDELPLTFEDLTLSEQGHLIGGLAGELAESLDDHFDEYCAVARELDAERLSRGKAEAERDGRRALIEKASREVDCMAPLHVVGSTLAESPSDALDAVKAAVWAECVASMVHEDGTPVEIVPMRNPYAKENRDVQERADSR